ncbi:cuticle protein 7-like [Amphibalanus amphitrite]|uniref:cuticle protein 7-like n=1 Tax=Amphibalanus amphitrite TaxID=1232801 RepID=UPI001C90C3D5|nr:cuticle protein 7-like [Amphibalanus amphitrite]
MKAFIAVCLLAVVAADQKVRPEGSGRPQSGGRGGYSVSPGGFKTPVGSSDYEVEEYQYRPSPYAFDYAVRNAETGAEYAANENSDGTQTTGFYTVALPDGRIQTVKYTVDESGGFNAEVSYEGEATYPEPSEYEVQPTGRKQGPIRDYKPVAKVPASYRNGPVYRSNVAKTAAYEE